MENIINECVPHIGEHIFGLLNGPELCVSRLVCKSWNDFLIHRNKLWSNISDEILNGIKNTTSQQWRIIKSHKKDEDESRKICLMLLWYRQKCKQDGTKGTVSPFVTSFNYPSSLKYLLSLSQVKNPIDDYGAGVLHLAAVYGSLEAIRIIANELEDKNPPAKKLSYYTPLHFATVQNHVECIEYILELGIDANTKAYLGRTPLHIAAEHGHIEAVKCLLKHVKNKNPALDEDGKLWTPLHYACDQGHLDIVKYLISESKETSPLTLNNWTPLHIAVGANQVEIVRYLCNSVISDPNCQTIEGWTCAHLAAKMDHLTCLQVLSEHKDIDFNVTDNSNQTPFQLAIESEKHRIVDFFMDKCLKHGK